MKTRTKYWLEHCEVPHNSHELVMQCGGMVHDKFFWMTLAWGVGIIVMIGFLSFIAITSMEFAPIVRFIIPPIYPFV